MSLVTFTRPDNSLVDINPDVVLSIVEVPKDGPLAGPLKEGTRITFTNQTHQDVKELLPVVREKINAARAQHPTMLAEALRSGLMNVAELKPEVDAEPPPKPANKGRGSKRP